MDNEKCIKIILDNYFKKMEINLVSRIRLAVSIYQCSLREKSAILRNYIRWIDSQLKFNSAYKSPAVFDNFFSLLKFLQFC